MTKTKLTKAERLQKKRLKWVKQKAYEARQRELESQRVKADKPRNGHKYVEALKKLNDYDKNIVKSTVESVEADLSTGSLYANRKCQCRGKGYITRDHILPAGMFTVNEKGEKVRTTPPRTEVCRCVELSVVKTLLEVTG